MTLARLAILLTLTFIAAVALFASSVRLSGAAPSGWTAAGCANQDWEAAQGEPLTVTAQSCGLLYSESFSPSQPLAIEARVRCMPASSHDRCLAGIAIGNITPTADDDIACQYGNLNVAWHTWQDSMEEAASLVNCVPRHHGAYQAGEWRTLKVVSEPAGLGYVYYSLFLDGQLLVRPKAALSSALTAKLQCVSITPATPSDGSLAHCEFTGVKITQPGDADCSGVVDAVDANVVLAYDVWLGGLPCPANADVNCDGQANVIDAMFILQWIAGLRLSLAC